MWIWQRWKKAWATISRYLWRWLAWHIPRNLVEWSVARAWIHASTGRWHGVVVSDVRVIDALIRWKEPNPLVAKKPVLWFPSPEEAQAMPKPAPRGPELLHRLDRANARRLVVRIKRHCMSELSELPAGEPILATDPRMVRFIVAATRKCSATPQRILSVLRYLDIDVRAPEGGGVQ